MKKEEPGMTSGSIMQSEEASDGLPVPSHLYLLERPYPSAFRARFWFAIGSRDYQDVFSLQKATFFLSSFSPHVLFSLFWTARRHREGFKAFFSFHFSELVVRPQLASGSMGMLFVLLRAVRERDAFPQVERWSLKHDACCSKQRRNTKKLIYIFFVHAFSTFDVPFDEKSRAGSFFSKASEK
jgi:hypothetical protein